MHTEQNQRNKLTGLIEKDLSEINIENDLRTRVLSKPKEKKFPSHCM